MERMEDGLSVDVADDEFPHLTLLVKNVTYGTNNGFVTGTDFLYEDEGVHYNTRLPLSSLSGFDLNQEVRRFKAARRRERNTAKTKK